MRGVPSRSLHRVISQSSKYPGGRFQQETHDAKQAHHPGTWEVQKQDDITPRMENQMEKNMENDIETGVYRDLGFPKFGVPVTPCNGERNGNWGGGGVYG